MWIWVCCYCIISKARTMCISYPNMIAALGPFKVLCLIKAGIKSRLWPSSLMTNYWQLAQRMASLRPFFSPHPVLAISTRTHTHTHAIWHVNTHTPPKGLKNKPTVSSLLCANARGSTEGLQVSSYRILKQIPIGRHTFYLCGVFNSAGVRQECSAQGEQVQYRLGLTFSTVK